MARRIRRRRSTAAAAQPAADKPDEGLPKIAAVTGGGYFELTSTSDLAATFSRVADELHRQYALGFTPDKLDGKMHALEVRVAGEGMTARARKSYLARARRRSETCRRAGEAAPRGKPSPSGKYCKSVNVFVVRSADAYGASLTKESAVAKKATKKKSARKPNAAFMKPVTPDARAVGGDRIEGRAAHRGHQEAVGLHQEERPAGQEEPAQHQRRRGAQAGVRAARPPSTCSR